MLQPWLQFSPISSDKVLLTSSAHHRIAQMSISYLATWGQSLPPSRSALPELPLWSCRAQKTWKFCSHFSHILTWVKIKKLSHQSGMVRYGGFGQEPTTVVLKGIFGCCWSKNIKKWHKKRKTWRHISDVKLSHFGINFAGRFQHSAANDQDFSQQPKDSSRSQEKGFRPFKVPTFDHDFNFNCSAVNGFVSPEVFQLLLNYTSWHASKYALWFSYMEVYLYQRICRKRKKLFKFSTNIWM